MTALGLPIAVLRLERKHFVATAHEPPKGLVKRGTYSPRAMPSRRGSAAPYSVPSSVIITP